MKQSTISAVMANSIKNLLQRYTKGIRFTAILTLLFTIGVGSMLGAEAEVTVSLSDGEHDGTNITWTAADGNITITQSKGTSTTAVNSSYISAPRVYKGHILSFEAKDGYKIKQINLKCNSTYYGNSMTAGTVVTNNNVTNNTSEVSRTWTTTSGGTHVVSSVSSDGLSAIYIQNVASASNVQLRLTSIVITYVEESSIPANPYTVTLKDDNSTLPQSTAGAAITLPSRDGCDGYTFAGWTKSWSVAQTTWTTTAPTIIPSGSYTPTANESLYPVYTKTEGGTPVPATLTASYSSHSGWTATGCGGSSYWVLKQNASITSPVISDLSTVTSITFKVRTYGGSSYNTVNVSTSGGTSIGSATASNTTLTLKTINVSPKLSGSGSIVFSSTTTSSSNGPGINEITINYSTGGSTTYYISVPDCATQTTITLSKQGGSGGTSSVTATYGQPMPEITVPTLAGYDFQGYFTANGGSGTKYYNANGTSAKNWDKEDATFTLIAYWKAKTYTVTLNNQGATTAGATSVTATYKAPMPSIASNLPKKTGYAFQGYFDAISGGTKYYNADGTSAKNWDKTSATTLYAQWICETPVFDIKIKNDNPVIFSGETIELTVVGSNIAADATYQWYKGEDEIVGETTDKLTIANATADDAGNYKCEVSNATCSAENNYTVKMYHIKGLTDGTWTTPFEFVKSGDKEGTFSVELAANTTYYFKLNDGSVWYWNEGTMTHNNCTDWVIEQEGADTQGKANTGITTTASGTYTFILNYEDPSKPKLSVTYPQKKMVYLNPGNWNCPKYAVYSWVGDENSTVLMTKIDDCAGRNIYQAEIDASHSNVIFIGGTASYDVANTWTNVSYQTIDLAYPSDDKVLYEINTTHLFLVPNSNWKQSNARFAAYFYGNGETWVSMTKVTADLYKVTIPTTKTYPSVIFCRMNPSAAANNWNNKWNQSADLTITKGKNHYTIEDGTWDKGNGTWKTAGDWTAFTPNYTVTFDANGHGTAPADQCIAEGGKVTTPTAPTATGYTFGGWYKEAGCTNAWDFANDVVNSDITLYAKWTINTHTVTWKPAGGNWGGNFDDIVEEYAYGEEIKAPEKPAYDCHEFVAWDPVYTVDMTMPDDDLEFTAQWNKLSYTITFKNYDGTVLQTSTVECGETPSYTGATPTREQTAQYTYTFKGWSPTIASVTQDQVYTAQFTQTTRQYTVTWYDGTGNAHKTQSANYNATISVPTTDPDPCDDEYPYFIGWTADPIVGSTTTQPTLVENVKVTGDCDYYAVFAKGEAGGGGSYVLDYTAENLGSSNKWGSYGTAYTHTAKDGSTWVIKAYKSSGMQINTGKNASIKIPSCPSPITSIEITGSTTKAVGLSASDYTGSGTITYIVTGQDNTSQTLDFAGKNVTNGYIVAKSGSISITKITVNFTAPTNYTSFITTCCTSWSAPILTYTTPLEENGTAMPQITGTTHGTVTYESSNPSILSVNSTTGEITAKAPGTAKITATWSGDATYCSVSSTSNVITVKGSFSVIYYSNGGTGTMPNQKADENNVIAQLNANQFTRDGYAFVGWNTKANGTGTAYADQATNITLTGNLTLYAQWAAIVTLNDAGTETTTHPATAGGTITLPDGANACSPYEFVGWTSDATADWNEGINEPALVATTYTPNAPTTLYAVYRIQSEGNANAFKLSFEGGNGKTYYVGEYGYSPYLRGYSNIPEADAVTFIRKKMYPNDDTKYYLYLEHLEEYLYCSSGNLYTTSNEPSESQGWVFHTIGDKIQIQAINQEKYLSYSDRDDDRINITTHSTGSQESFNMLSAVTSTYVASPLCNQEIEIIFETGNGDFVDNAPATNPLTVTLGETITLPTCEYPGYEFMGWLKDEQQLDPSDIPLTYYTGDYTVNGTSSTITFYAYYKAIPEEVEFTGKDDAELLMYYYDGTANYYYAVSHAAERGELSSKQNCFNATTWTFTNVGNMQYYIQDETDKYLGAYSDGDNDLILSATPKVWTFTEVNGLWKMVCENSPSRALMYISTGKTFTNAAISNEGNGAYSYVSLGICPSPTYTTNPVLTQGFTITNTVKVTSASGQNIKAANALTLETRNIELPCTFTITAPNITFYDNTGAEVTQLTASAASEQFELYFAYQPTAENTMEYPTVTIVDDELKTYTIKNRIQARSLPNTFAIVAKVGGMWYALPSQGLNSTDALVGYPVEVDNLADPTAVTAVPTNADWSLRQVYASSRDLDRFKAGGHNLVFVNNVSPEKALNPSSSSNYLLTNAQYNNYHNATNPGLYEWTPTTTDLETYQLTNVYRTTKQLNIATNTVFGVHATEVVTADVRFLPIQNRYTPMAVQAVEWKENSVVVMYNGNPAQTASVSVNAGAAQTTELSSAQKDIAVYELTANGLATNPTQSLSITIGTEKAILPIPYIISREKTDLALLPGDATVAARQEVAKVADLVVLKDAKLTADGAKGNPYKFRNVTIYGGGKLVIPSDKGFGVASLTLRAGGITDAGEYDYVYPQFELRGTFTNTAGKFYYDYITDYYHWYHLVLPFAGELGSITYPTEFYGTNVTADNTGSWVIKRYAGEIRATGNYNAWKDIETEGETSTIAGKGYIFWGAPKKVTVNGKTDRQKWGIQRITMPTKANEAMPAENADKTISNLGSYENVANKSGKPNDQGWNLIGNPYMVNLTTMSEVGLKAGKLEKDSVDGNWTGKWINNGDGIRYLTIPSNHFDTYEAKTVNAAITASNLVPGRAFFIQLEGEANGVTFSAANRASLMPQHLAAQNTAVEVETGIVLSNETMQDEVNFWIKDGKTNDYEYNADYPKTPNNTNFNIYGVHAHGDLSWVATGPEYAEESMPIGYQVPAAGTYTLSISETYYSDLLDALYVTDHAMSPELTVDLMNAPYEFSVNQAETNNERFTVSLKLKSENQGPATGLENIGVQTDGTIKFIYHDKIFILHNGTIYDATGKQVTTINK